MIFQPITSITFEAELTSSEGEGFDVLEDLIAKKSELESELANMFADKLKEVASSYLYSTKDRYLEAISTENGVVTLDTSDFVVDMVEVGKRSFDMKPGFLESPKAKVNAQGKKYAVIPISKYRRGKYNWRDRKTGRFSTGTNIGGDVEFRIVSENSPADSWIHPGHHGFRFIHNAMQDFEEVIDNYIDEKITTTLNKL